MLEPSLTTGTQCADQERSALRGTLTEEGEREAHLCEVHEVLEAGVEVGLLIQRAHMLEMGVVDVGIHTEEALEYGADDNLK